MGSMPALRRVLHVWPTRVGVLQRIFDGMDAELPVVGGRAATVTRIGVEDSLRSPVSTGTRARFRRGRTRTLAIGDLVALTLAYVGAYVVADAIAPLSPVSAAPWFLVLVGVTAPIVWLAVFTAYGLYENDTLRISVSSFDEVRDLFHAMLVGSLGYLILSQAVDYFFDWWVYTAVESFLFMAGALVLVPILRGTIRSWVFPRVMTPRRTLIVGSGHDALLVYRKIATHPEYGLEVVGFLDGDSPDPLPAPMLGSPADVARVVDEFDIDRVLLASSVGSHEETLDLVRTVRRPDVLVSIVPRYFEIFTSHATLDDVEGMPVVTLPPMRLGRSARILKRTMDITIAGTALIVLSPLLAAVAIAIKLDSKGPALYRQPRRGRLGSTFSIVKFRSMHTGAEQRRAEVLHMNEVDGPLFKIKGVDPRVTRVGAFIRKTSIDELPQLWNVLRGDMSLVGPRPFVVYEADQITGWALRRLDMTPGITGLWQVLGRNDIPFEEMTKLDYLYVTNWSLWWDLKIMCQTVPVVLGKRGAY
jgi:exopolysaccharide biosynthesis polyprenyl glycosylphosphotransferase